MLGTGGCIRLLLCRGDYKYIKMKSVMDSQSFNGEIPFLFPIRRHLTIQGLFLKQGDAAEEVYSRIGYFEIDIGLFWRSWSDDKAEILG
jgi:hypothetical protein